MPQHVLEPFPDQPIKTVAVRLPADMHAELVRLARESGQSLHGQLLATLEQALLAVEEQDVVDP